MIHLHITAELADDEYGPGEVHVERCVLPRWFAADACEAHAKLLTLGVIPLNSETVRSLVAWEA